MARLSIAVLALGFVCSSALADDATQADREFFAGNFDRAQQPYQTVESANPAYESALRQLGAIALYENRLDDAERQLRLAIAKDSADTKTDALLAEAASRRGDFASAARWLHLAGKTARADAFAEFGSATPYRIVSDSTVTRIAFAQTDPLPAVEASVNGVAGLFIIDTGAAEIALDPDFARRASIAGVAHSTGTFAGGKTAGIAYGRIAKFSLAPLEVADVPAVLVATAGFTGVTGGKPVAGIIGTEFLSRFRATLDYPAGALILASRDADTTQIAPYAEIPFLLVRDHFILAQGALDNGPQQLFFVDTGLAGFAFAAPASTLTEVGIALPVASAQDPADPVGQSAATPFGINNLSLGMLHRENLAGLYGPFPPSLESGTGVHIGGIVSHAFFRPYALTFDFRRMVLEIGKPPV